MIRGQKFCVDNYFVVWLWRGSIMWPSLEADKTSRERLLSSALLKVKDLQACSYVCSLVESIFIIHETSVSSSFKFLFLHCSPRPTS